MARQGVNVVGDGGDNNCFQELVMDADPQNQLRAMHPNYPAPLLGSKGAVMDNGGKSGG